LATAAWAFPADGAALRASAGDRRQREGNRHAKMPRRSETSHISVHINDGFPATLKPPGE
ncbi:MAG: hypothetical protein WA005_16885, partial [Candidatus Binataceae bacterium]